MAHKLGDAGKLKRVSIVPEGPRQNLARPGDLYDIDLSPEKGRYALPEKVNHKKLKVWKKKNNKVEQRRRHRPIDSSDTPLLVAGGRGPVEDLAHVEVGNDDDNHNQSSGEGRHSSSSLAKVALASSDEHVNTAVEKTDRSEHVVIEEQLANGKPRCTAVSYKYDRHMGSRYQQCRRPGSYTTETGMQCRTHNDKPPATRCGEITVTQGTTTQCHRISTVETVNGARCPTHENQHATQRPKARAEGYIPSNAQLVSKRKLILLDGSDVPRKSKKSIPPSLDSSDPAEKNSPQVQIPVRKSRKQRSTKEPTNTGGNTDTGIDEQPELGHVRKVGRPRKQSSEENAGSIQQASDGVRRIVDNIEGSMQATTTAGGVASDNAPDEDESEHVNSDPDGSGKVPRYATEHTGDIETVFNFLDLEERPGNCQTKLATLIARMCLRFSPKQDDSMSMDELMERVNRVHVQLKRIHTDLEETDQPAFKTDAYGHVFCYLTLLLKAVYDWMSGNCGTVTESLEALRILSPLIGDILALKDTVATWNVSVAQRYKGDRMVRDVDSRLIAPLRRVEKVYRTRLSQLENVQRRREQQEVIQRRAQQQAEAEQMYMEAQEKRRKAWTRWQALHIVRMQCEPNPHRRQKLVITGVEPLEAAGERDANGFEFERVPVFTSRSHPPQHSRLTRSDNHDWTEEEEMALIHGLEHCAGLFKSFPTVNRYTLMVQSGPRVFEGIFQRYCDPRGPPHLHRGALRNCSVTEITARSARFRADLHNLYQNNGWQIPEWVKSIPVLP